MLFETFVVGTVGFWLLSLLFVVLMFCYTEYEKGTASTFTLAFFLGLLALGGNFNIFKYAAHHPVIMIAILVLYFILGTAWAVTKWWFYVRDRRERYDEYKTDWIKINGPIDDNKPKFASDLRSAGLVDGYGSTDPRPLAKDHKSRIMFWMGDWVFSFLWSILNDMVKKIWKEVYRRIATHLQDISDKAFAGTEKDLSK